MSNTPNAASFEDAVSRLEEIVTALEAGNLPLDECLKRFETAVGLSRFCAATLESAEKQIRVLSADGVPQPADDLPWAAEAAGATDAAPAGRTRSQEAAAVIQSNFDWDA
jgi:exodeoxyribonuclease VII small subunit